MGRMLSSREPCRIDSTTPTMVYQPVPSSVTGPKEMRRPSGDDQETRAELGQRERKPDQGERMRAESHEGEAAGIQHQLDRNQHDDDVASHEHSDRSEREQRTRKSEHSPD